MANVQVLDSPSTAGRMIAHHIASRIREQPTLVLGVATGSTPMPVYEALAEHAATDTDCSRITVVALDEYVGLPAGHPQSYRSELEEMVAVPLQLKDTQVHVPDGSRAGLESAGERFEATLRSLGGIDIQLLGIGATGHIGFNEPGSSFASLTRVKTLTQRTRADNARFFDSAHEVPIHCVTQGLGTIARARHLIMMAFGQVKAGAVAAALEGPVRATMPASMIQLHPHVTVVLDHEAAVQLEYLDYYRDAQRNAPAWQGL